MKSRFEEMLCSLWQLYTYGTEKIEAEGYLSLSWRTLYNPGVSNTTPIVISHVTYTTSKSWRRKAPQKLSRTQSQASTSHLHTVTASLRPSNFNVGELNNKEQSQDNSVKCMDYKKERQQKIWHAHPCGKHNLRFLACSRKFQTQ